MLELLVLSGASLDSTVNLLWMFSVCDSDSHTALCHRLSVCLCLSALSGSVWKSPKCPGCILVAWSSAQMPWAHCSAKTCAYHLQLQKVLYLPGCSQTACMGLHFGIKSKYTALGIHLRRLCSHFTQDRGQQWDALVAQWDGFHGCSSQHSISMKGCEVTDAKIFATPPFLLYELAAWFTFWVSLPSAAVMLGPWEELPCGLFCQFGVWGFVFHDPLG